MYVPAAPPTLPTPSVNLATGKDLIMNNPTPFSGKKEHIEIFLDGLMIKYHYMPQTYPDDQSKISDLLSLIAENSNTTYWKTTIMLKLVRHLRDPSEPLPFATWSEFKMSFCKFFGIIDERGASQAQLERIYQGSWLAEEFNHRFQEVARKTEYNKVALHYK